MEGKIAEDLIRRRLSPVEGGGYSTFSPSLDLAEVVLAQPVSNPASHYMERYQWFQRSAASFKIWRSWPHAMSRAIPRVANNIVRSRI